MCRRIPFVPEHATAVLAQVQMAVEPAIGTHVGRDIPPSAAEVADEDPATVEPCPRSSRTAHEDVLLMAMDDISCTKLVEDGTAEGIGALFAHEPWVPYHADSKRSTSLITALHSETDESRGDDVGHVPRQFAGVPLGAADDAVRAKQRGNEMDDAHALLQHLELVIQEPRRKHPCPSMLVGMRPTVRGSTDDPVHERRVEADTRVATLESGDRIVSQRIHRAERLEAIPAKPVTVRDVGECVCAREVRNRDVEYAARLADSMNLLENRDDIYDMLQDIVGVHFIETVRREWPWRHVQIVNDVS